MYSPTGIPATVSGGATLYRAALEQSLTQLYLTGRGLLLPLPAEVPPALQPGPQGFDLDARRLLLTHAANPNQSILVLGGDLSNSAFGAPEPARMAFRYLDGHPWLDLLTAPDLLEEPLDSKNTAPAPLLSDLSVQFLSALANRLAAAPDNALTLAARQALRRLRAPIAPSPPEEELFSLAAIRQNFATQVELLLDAANWAAQPGILQSCRQDYDKDGLPECIWSDGSFFAVWHGRSGALTHLFVLLPDGPHQMVGPSSQMIAAQSPPGEWQLAAGWLSDPQVIPGGFALPGAPPQIELYPNGVSLRNEQTQIDYFFSPTRITIRLQTPSAQEQILPLLLDPWLLEVPGGSDFYPAASAICSWGIKDSFTLQISTSLPCRLDAFTATRTHVGEVENPNLELPPGHYLPLPLAVLHFAPDSNQVAEIQITILAEFPPETP